jgi:hypothetical protein
VRPIKRGSTSVRRLIFIADTSKTDGSGLPNLVYNSSGLVAYYFAGDLTNEVSISLADPIGGLGTWTSGGFIAVDNTNMPGWYEIGIPDAALDGGNEVALQFRGATNMAVVNLLIALDAVDYQTEAFGALQPTTAGRTLAVSTDGKVDIAQASIDEIGSDFLAHVLAKGSPGTIENTLWKISKTNASAEGEVDDATPTASQFTTNLTGPADEYNDQVVAFTSGALTGEARAIESCTESGGVLTLNMQKPFTSAPADEDEFLILPQQVYSIAAIQGETPDRLAYLLAILAGAISDAGTAAETYTITLGANTFTVDYSGLDATGNRTGATLSKT